MHLYEKDFLILTRAKETFFFLQKNMFMNSHVAMELSIVD